MRLFYIGWNNPKTECWHQVTHDTYSAVRNEITHEDDLSKFDIINFGTQNIMKTVKTKELVKLIYNTLYIVKENCH